MVARPWLVIVPLLVVAAVLIPLLLSSMGGSGPAATSGAVAIHGRVVDEDKVPVAHAGLTLTSGAHTDSAASAPDGSFTFQAPAAPSCSIQAVAAGFLTTTLSFDCRTDALVELRLEATTIVPGGPGVAPSGPGEAPTFPVSGQVVDTQGGALAGAFVRFDNDALSVVARTAIDGTYLLQLPPGDYNAIVDLDCYSDGATDVTIDAPQAVSFRLDRRPATLPGPPRDLAAHPGPGVGMITLTWDAPAEMGDPETVSYAVYRTDPGGEEEHVITTGNSRAFGDMGRMATETYAYRVAALSPCGGAGAFSDAVDADGTGVPGVPVEVAWFPYFTANTTTQAMDRTAANGTPMPPAEWRVSRGFTEPFAVALNQQKYTGNRAEDYLYVAADGTIYDLGGFWLTRSRDEGITWERLDAGQPSPDGRTFYPGVFAEGAVAGAPNGDIVAANWAGLSDNMRAIKYSASEDRWYVQESTLHNPLHDRPWLSVLKGPFYLEDDVVAPYATLLSSNLGVHEGVAWISYDGLNYVRADLDALQYADGPRREVPLGSLAYDQDREWLQPVSETFTVPLGPGLNLRTYQHIVADVSGEEFCDWVVTTATADWACAALSWPRFENASFHLGAAPVIVAVHLQEDDEDDTFRGFRLATSTDGGATWSEHRESFTDGWRFVGGTLYEVNLQINSPDDEAALLMVLANDVTRERQDVLYRFGDLSVAPRLTEVIRFPPIDADYDDVDPDQGTHPLDFTTLGYLPDGRLVVSFGDRVSGASAVAIEL